MMQLQTGSASWWPHRHLIKHPRSSMLWRTGLRSLGRDNSLRRHSEVKVPAGAKFSTYGLPVIRTGRKTIVDSPAPFAVRIALLVLTPNNYEQGVSGY